MVGIVSAFGDLARASSDGIAFEHDGESAGLLDGAGRRPADCLGLRRACDLEAAHLVDRLRRQADVPHHRDPDLDEPRGSTSATRAPPSSLTAAAPPSWISRPALRTASSTTDLVGQERHVGDDQGALRSAATAAVWWTILSSVTGERRLMAHDHHAERIADEQRVDRRRDRAAGPSWRRRRSAR